MSVTMALRGRTNWHTLHCDHDGCRASFTVDYTYGHLDRLREIAARDAGWVGPDRNDRTPMSRQVDFCFGHRVALAAARFRP